MRKIILIIALFFSVPVMSKDVAIEVLQKAKRASVTINARLAVAAYGNTGNHEGTGFITNKAQGLVVTNHHVAGRSAIGNYYITFHTGQQAEAKVLYADSWQDVAIFSIDPKLIPESCDEVKFSDDLPKLNDDVFIVGNNEAQDFSFHNGIISNLYEINGQMPQQTYVVNLNSAGGSSGSPLMTLDGKAVGLHYGGSKTYGLSVKGGYIKHILSAIEKGEAPKRQHVGFRGVMYSLDKLVRHTGFPKDKMAAHLKEFPDTRNQAVMVGTIIAGSPAYGKLRAGDVIWKINGKKVGSSLFEIDDAMNKAKKAVNFTIFREGKEFDIKVPLYNVNAKKITEMVEFGGAMFFAADDYFSAKSGIPLGSLSVVSVGPGSTMSVVGHALAFDNRIHRRFVPVKIGGFRVKSLNDVKAIIPQVIPQKDIRLEYRNFIPFHESFAGALNSTHNFYVTDISFDSLDQTPRALKFMPESLDWDAEKIEIKKSK